jgi:hypothetical protein
VLGLSLAYANEAFGLRAGLNLTNRTYSGSNDIDTDNRIGSTRAWWHSIPLANILFCSRN